MATLKDSELAVIIFFLTIYIKDTHCIFKIKSLYFKIVIYCCILFEPLNFTNSYGPQQSTLYGNELLLCPVCYTRGFSDTCFFQRYQQHLLNIGDPSNSICFNYCNKILTYRMRFTLWNVPILCNTILAHVWHTHTHTNAVWSLAN